ncbi:MAG: hypothetical protein HW421_3203 [Ignavibacteria bacterium]|nr:hypothetical protein [Ignavibacteria bacterium]
MKTMLFFLSFLFLNMNFSNAQPHWVQTTGTPIINSWVRYISIDNKRNLFANPANYAYKSSDRGDSWLLLKNLKLSYGDYSRFFCTKSGICLAALDSGLLLSSDEGNLWEKADISDNIFSFAESSLGRIYLGGINNLYYSVDYGKNWSIIPTGSNDYITSIDILNEKYILIGTRVASLIFLSSDTGKTFHRLSISQPEGNYSQVIFTRNAGIMVNLSDAQGDGRTMLSNDTGKTFYEISEVNFPSDFLKSDKKGNIYIGSQWGLFRTTNEGKSWENISDGLPPNNYITDICFGNNNDAYISSRYGVYRCEQITNVDEYDGKGFNEITIFPNPSNKFIIVQFSVTVPDFYLIQIYDLFGNILFKNDNEYLPEGIYKKEIDLVNASQGLYFCRISSKKEIRRKLLSIVK